MSARGGRGGRGGGGAGAGKRGGGGGRGGRGGRGRGGRGGDVDLPGGLQQEEPTVQVTQPPPIFPPIEHRAPKLEITDEWPYLFELKRDYAESLFESTHNVDVNKRKDIDRWSDCLAAEMVSRSRYDKFCDWSVIPKELKPRGEKRKGKTAANGAKKSKEIDVQAKLAKLEAEEQTEKDPDDLEEEEKSSDEEDGEEKGPEEDLEDEEMDEGTDYANNYFKNGEEDEEEDDVYEEGGVF